jgi:hypothetical protein
MKEINLNKDYKKRQNLTIKRGQDKKQRLKKVRERKNYTI